MKLLIKVVFVFSSMGWPMLLEPQWVAASEFVGVREVMAHVKERASDLGVMVWYPADLAGRQVSIGETAFFRGTKAMFEVPVAEGKYPLILLSHGVGLGGNPQAMSWIATPLAKQGFIVAAPMHPGNSGANRSARETMRLWLRPTDISATLDRLAGQSGFAEHLEDGKVAVLGLSMGGGTALALAGARIDPTRLASYCDNDAFNPSLCGWVRQSGVDLHGLDMKLVGRNSRDKRVLFVMAIDPAPLEVFQARTFSQIAIPVEIVSLGRVKNTPETAMAAGVAKAISGAKYSTLEDASHYSLFGECQADAEEIAKSEQIDEPICSDGAGQSRRDIHRQLITKVSEAFNRELRLP